MEFILENVTDSIWAIDRNYDILYLNNAFRTEFQKKIGSNLGIGDNVLAETPSPVRTFWKEKYDRSLKGERCTFDTEIPGIDNKTTYISVSFSPIIENNEITGVTCFGRDVTQEKLSSLELEKYSLLLKVSLESQKDTILFTIDKSYNYMFFNSAHFQVMKYAYDAEIEVGMNSLAYISNLEDREVANQNYTRALNGESHHNIRIYGDQNKEYYESFFNPIYDSAQNIIGATGMARNITERVNQQEALKKSEESLRKANTTKNKFFSLLAHDLKSPTASLNSFLQIFYENSNIAVNADEHMISAVIRNLVSNAIKYSHNEGIINISIESRDDKPEHLLISVKDMGVGISKERKEKIFCIGEYIATPGTKDEKGTGLGLIMCKEFLDRHKGKITINSKENQGTSVLVEIPQTQE